jgi:hypothetical protein
MKSTRVFVACGLAALAIAQCRIVTAQIVDTADDEVAGIPVNYTEARVGLYTLPDPLTLSNGEKVTDARTWIERRRPEILKLIEENQYGRAPGRPADMSFDVFDKGTPAFDERARRKQVKIYFATDHSDNYLDLLLYLPADAEGPVPMLLEVGWGPNNLAVDGDDGVRVGRAWNPQTKMRTPAEEGRRFGAPLNVMQLIERGYGVATFNYNDIDPDSLDSLAHGVRALYLKDGKDKPAADEWGSISAWAWGISRIIDYFETDADVDAARIAVTGASRLGKTVLWAGARDERIACVIASVSGEGGAALSRRNYGETVAHLVAPTRFPYQFAGNYANWAGRMDEAPFDAHFVIALIAPRPLLLQTGYTDKWSDPYGEFLAAKAATPVYELLGKKGIETYSQPGLGEPMMNTLGYLMHDGGHGVMPQDWPVFLDFLDRYLKGTGQTSR